MSAVPPVCCGGGLGCVSNEPVNVEGGRQGDFDPFFTLELLCQNGFVDGGGIVQVEMLFKARQAAAKVIELVFGGYGDEQTAVRA